MANGNRFREQRRWAMHTLRDFGLGRSTIGNVICDELVDLRRAITDACKQNGPLDLTLSLSRAVANVTCVLVFGERLGVDPEFKRMTRYVEDVVGMQHKRWIAFLLARVVLLF